MRTSFKAVTAGFVLSSVLMPLGPFAWAGPKEDVAAATSRWAQALGEDDPEKVLPLYADDAVLWGTLSPTVRADRAALRDYFVGAFKALPGLKVTFGEQLIRVYGTAAVQHWLLHVLLRKGRRKQELARTVQLQLRQERRSLAHCRPSLLGHAGTPEMSPRDRASADAR